MWKKFRKISYLWQVFIYTVTVGILYFSCYYILFNDKGPKSDSEVVKSIIDNCGPEEKYSYLQKIVEGVDFNIPLNIGTKNLHVQPNYILNKTIGKNFISEESGSMFLDNSGFQFYKPSTGKWEHHDINGINNIYNCQLNIFPNTDNIDINILDKDAKRAYRIIGQNIKTDLLAPLISNVSGWNAGFLSKNLMYDGWNILYDLDSSKTYQVKRHIQASNLSPMNIPYFIDDEYKIGFYNPSGSGVIDRTDPPSITSKGLDSFKVRANSPNYLEYHIPEILQGNSSVAIIDFPLYKDSIYLQLTNMNRTTKPYVRSLYNRNTTKEYGYFEFETATNPFDRWVIHRTNKDSLRAWRFFIAFMNLTKKDSLMANKIEIPLPDKFSMKSIMFSPMGKFILAQDAKSRLDDKARRFEILELAGDMKYTIITDSIDLFKNVNLNNADIYGIQSSRPEFLVRLNELANFHFIRNKISKWSIKQIGSTNWPNYNAFEVTSENNPFIISLLIALLLTLYGFGLVLLISKPQQTETTDKVKDLSPSLRIAFMEIEKTMANLNIRKEIMLWLGIIFGIGGVVAFYIVLEKSAGSEKITDWSFNTVVTLIRPTVLLIFVETFTFFFLKQYRVIFNEYKLFYSVYLRFMNLYQAMELKDINNEKDITKKVIEKIINSDWDLYERGSKEKIKEFDNSRVEAILEKEFDAIAKKMSSLSNNGLTKKDDQ